MRRFLQIAMGSASEVECELMLAVELGLLREEGSARLLEQVVEVKRMLSRLIVSFRAPATRASAI